MFGAILQSPRPILPPPSYIITNINSNKLKFKCFVLFFQVTYYLSSLVLTYAVSFIITVVVELPCANLEAIVWGMWEKEKVKDPADD